MSYERLTMHDVAGVIAVSPVIRWPWCLPLWPAIPVLYIIAYCALSLGVATFWVRDRLSSGLSWLARRIA